MYIIKYPEKGRFSPEGIVTKWDKNVGDAVKKGDLLVQIETSGECIQMESATDGELLKVLADTGRLVRSGDPLAVVGKTGEDISRATKQLEQKKASPENRAPKYQTKPKAKPPISVKTVQPAQSKKEEVMTTPKSTGSSDNVIPILMPQAGQSMEEGTILSWKVKEGDVIEVGQVIMEIETDKATMEVEADAAGRVARIVSAEGDIVEVKKPVAFIANNDADVDAFLVAEGRTAAPAAQSAPTPASAPAADAGPEGVVIPILMPQAGQSMEEGTILSWKINEGDTIEVGQVIMEIETDKATMEVEAVDAGRIAKIVAAEGDIVEVKAPVAYLAEEGVDVDAYIASGGIATTPAPKIASKPAGAKTAAPAVQKVPASVSASGRVKASPAARKAAADKGIDLASMGAGSGPGGRILSSDVDNADVITTKTQVHTLSKMRRAIGNNLLYSKQNIPHFYAKVTIDAGLLFTTYRTTKEQFKTFRSQYKDTELIENPSTNIGIAVGTDEGLTVPVVIGADQMNLEQLAARTREIVESARNGKLEGMGQGVFTITNLGMFGVEEFSAIINPPESAILAVGAIREGVVVENGAVRPTRLMTVTLSVDHRVIDGVLAAQFLKTFKELLESPEQLIS
ncbi:MAG: dihydrolipoamide acetyltransferase family protein [Planctomycetota bacterium]|jgi:pyruvate dehydrogenase E2 component (dihydrolipoamide acetyltransferase)